jgi:hypothetical protein
MTFEIGFFKKLILFTHFKPLFERNFKFTILKIDFYITDFFYLTKKL